MGREVFKAEFITKRRAGINDPAGKAIEGSLKQLGFEVSGVRLGKFTEVQFGDVDLESANTTATQMANKYTPLKNPVLDDCEIKVGIVTIDNNEV